jgi:hypothetical protein
MAFTTLHLGVLRGRLNAPSRLHAIPCRADDCWCAVVNMSPARVSKFAMSGFEDVATTGALILGLTAGGYWQSLEDWPHVQKRKAASPVSAGMTLAVINQTMQQRFG